MSTQSKKTAARLPYSDNRRWRWRWMQTQGVLDAPVDSKGIALHRITRSLGVDRRYGVITIDAETACGRRGKFHMPGIFSRMGAPRCKKCCKAIGIPFGNGAPYNKNISEVTR